MVNYDFRFLGILEALKVWQGLNMGGFKNLSAVVYMVFFLRNRLYLGHTSVTSFCVQFEKVGHGLLREGKRREGEWAVSRSEGDKEEYRS